MESVRKESVLLTGGSGFVATHVLDSLLAHGFSVVVTARSHEKGIAIIDHLAKDRQPCVSYEVVPDLARDGAFDHVFQADHNFDYVVHTASPVVFKVDDPLKDVLDPAIKGATGILKSIVAYAPSVKRIVITSSSAAMLNQRQHEKVYDETKWAPYTWEDALKRENAYPASKKFMEQAAWAFIAEHKPHFDLATINNTFTFGPIQPHLPSLDAINASNLRVRDLVLGTLRAAPLPPTFPVFTWVDVRDVALAHVRAMTVPLAAGGQRFYVVGGHFSNWRLAECIRRTHPALADWLPEGGEDDFPVDVYGFDNRRSREVLGLEYRGFEESVRDTVDSILEWQAKHS
ncbi:unnamed protein product [Discula destructiva]